MCLMYTSFFKQQALKLNPILQAHTVLGQFLVLKKNKELFQIWIKDQCGANNKQAGECYQCLADWCNEFL